MVEIKKFRQFFFSLGELCQQIRSVERPEDISDYTKINIIPDVLLERFPEVVASFYMSMHRTQAESIKCFLMKDGSVVVEFYDSNYKIENMVNYKTITEVRRNQISIIHHLSKISTRMDFNLFF